MILIVVGFTQLACGVFTPKPAPTDTLAPTTAAPPPTATPLPPTPTLPTTEVVIPPTEESPSAASGECTVFLDTDVTVYMRPSEESLVFGFVPTGLAGEVRGVTEDGWIGFEPGVAQAGNVGVFRLRWIPPDAGVELNGECDNLPVLWGPPAGVCFAMFMEEANIYESPSVLSPVITSVTIEQTAQILGKLGDNWIQLDLSVGNMDIDQKGWVEKEHIAYNGPCKDLPMITP